MAFELEIFDIGVCKAGADLSAKQFYGVQLSAAKTVTLAGDADADLFGVLQNKPTANRAAAIRRIGISQVVLGDTVAAHNPLTTDANGKFVPAASGERYCCRALEAGTADKIVTAIMEFGEVA